MVNKITAVLIDFLFPYTYLERYLQDCKSYQFQTRLTPRIQHKERQFSPFYYKDSLIKDCVIELKERNNIYVAHLFGEVLVQYIRYITESIIKKNPDAYFYLVPIPQHKLKTKDKGFLHTRTLCTSILRFFLNRINQNIISIQVFECLIKVKETRRLHDLNSRKNRFKTIKNTMECFITKYDAEHAYFFVVDDVYTTGSTFKEARRTLLGSGVPNEHIYFISIAH